MKFHKSTEVQLSKETQKAIYRLIINDYEKQFEQFKAYKDNYDYKEYRRKYTYICNRIAWYKNKLKKIEE